MLTTEIARPPSVNSKSDGHAKAFEFVADEDLRVYIELGTIEKPRRRPEPVGCCDSHVGTSAGRDTGGARPSMRARHGNRSYSGIHHETIGQAR